MKYLSLIILLFIFSCSENNESIPSTGSNSENGSHIPYDALIDGPANIRNEINGEIIFEFNDGVRVQTTKFENDWCRTGTKIKITQTERSKGIIKQGDKLIDIEGNIIGKAIADIEFEFDGEINNEYNAYIEGYTHKKNIKQESLIEFDLTNFLSAHTRKKKDMEEFIAKHSFEGDDIYLNYSGVYKYENWITDPSAGFRILFLFENDNLQGILHSRNRSIPNTITTKLEFDYKVTFFRDVSSTDQNNFEMFMNEWLQGVD